MKTSRWILTMAAVAVVAGIVVGAAAYLGTPGVAAQSSSLPATMAWLPADASIVGHIDLTSLFASPLRDRWEQRLETEPMRGDLEEFREMTGLDPFTDLQHVSFAVVTRDGDGDAGQIHGGRPSAESWGLSIRGAFDVERLLDRVETFADIDTEDYDGQTIYYPSPRETRDEHDGPGSDEPPAFAFPDETTMVLADRDYIRQMLDAGRGRITSAGPAVDRSWGEGSFVNDTFWIAAAPENGFSGMLPEGGEIPSIHSFALSGKLESDVALRARGLAADPDSAIKLADVVRGFVALGSLRQGRNPDIEALLSSVQIQRFGNEVDVSLTVPYETVERLSQRSDKTEAQPN